MSRRFTTPLFAVAALISASAGASPEKRFFTVAAVEPKGATTAEKEPYPAEALPSGGGYVIKQPDPTGRWEVSAYVWLPSQIIVNEGDEVTIEFVGINGASHLSGQARAGCARDLHGRPRGRVSNRVCYPQALNEWRVDRPPKE